MDFLKETLDDFISIHAPRVGGDTEEPSVIAFGVRFQSTPPVWGATWQDGAGVITGNYFNPRPPCGGRPKLMGHEIVRRFISIHAPRVGGDFCS